MTMVIDGTNGVTYPGGATELFPLTSGTAVATTSGTIVTFTGIPAGVKRITMMFNGVSTSGSSIVQIQLGTAGGYVTSGYTGNGSSCGNSGSWTLANATTGFFTDGSGASNYVRNGIALLCNVTSNSWVYSGTYGVSTASIASVAGGSLSLGAQITSIRLTTVNGTDTFTAGSVNVFWE
jgi:hypothetical protein